MRRCIPLGVLLGAGSRSVVRIIGGAWDKGTGIKIDLGIFGGAHTLLIALPIVGSTLLHIARARQASSGPVKNYLVLAELQRAFVLFSFCVMH